MILYEKQWSVANVESFGFMLKSALARYCLRPIVIFLRKLYTDFHNSCIIMYFHQQWITVFPFLCPVHYLLSFIYWKHTLLSHLIICFIGNGHLFGKTWNLKVVLTCISLISKDNERLKSCLPTICVSWELSV